MAHHALQGLGELLVGKALALLWGDTTDIHLTCMLLHLPYQLQVVEGLEEVFVIDLELAFLQFLFRNPSVLIVVAYLVGMWIQTAIGRDDTIAVEVVVGSRIASIVTTISEDFLTGNRTLIAHALIDEVPDVTTLVRRILADNLPVLLKASHRITHGVGIFTLNQWLFNLTTRYLAFRILLTPIVIGIHGAEDIRLTLDASTLILYRTGLIVSLYPIVSLLEVRTIASLVTQTPNDNAGVVLIGTHVTLLTLDVSLLKVRTNRQGLILVTHTMCFEVRLGSKVETILIAKIVPARIVGIVASTNGIDIQVLHNLDILNHALYRNDVTTIGVEFVAIGTLNQNRLSVNEQLSTLDLDMTETDFLSYSLQYIIALLQLKL